MTKERLMMGIKTYKLGMLSLEGLNWDVDTYTAAIIESKTSKEFSEDDMEMAMARIALFTLKEGAKSTDRIPSIIQSLKH